MSELKKILYCTIAPALVTAALITGIKYASIGPNVELNNPQLKMCLTGTAFHFNAKNWNHYKEIDCEDDGINCSWDSVIFTDWSRGGYGGGQSSHYGNTDFSKYVKICDEIKQKAITQGA